MATDECKASECFWATLSRRQFVKAGGALVVGCQPGGPAVFEGRYRKVRCVEELARSVASQFLDRDSSGQHDPHSYRQERLRPEHDFHGVSANCGRRIERSL